MLNPYKANLHRNHFEEIFAFSHISRNYFLAIELYNIPFSKLGYFFPVFFHFHNILCKFEIKINGHYTIACCFLKLSVLAIFLTYGGYNELCEFGASMKEAFVKRTQSNIGTLSAHVSADQQSFKCALMLELINKRVLFLTVV